MFLNCYFWYQTSYLACAAFLVKTAVFPWFLSKTHTVTNISHIACVNMNSNCVIGGPHISGLHIRTKSDQSHLWPYYPRWARCAAASCVGLPDVATTDRCCCQKSELFLQQTRKQLLSSLSSLPLLSIFLPTKDAVCETARERDRAPELLLQIDRAADGVSCSCWRKGTWASVRPGIHDSSSTIYLFKHFRLSWWLM